MRPYLHLALCAMLVMGAAESARAAGPAGGGAAGARQDTYIAATQGGVSMERDMRGDRQIEAKPVQPPAPAQPETAVPYAYPDVQLDGQRFMPSPGNPGFGSDPGIFRYGPGREDRQGVIVREDPPPRFRK